MEAPISAREWGREQARNSPVWSEDKWRRIGAIFGIEFAEAQEERAENARDAA